MWRRLSSPHDPNKHGTHPLAGGRSTRHSGQSLILILAAPRPVVLLDHDRARPPRRRDGVRRRLPRRARALPDARDPRHQRHPRARASGRLDQVRVRLRGRGAGARCPVASRAHSAGSATITEGTDVRAAHRPQHRAAAPRGLCRPRGAARAPPGDPFPGVRAMAQRMARGVSPRRRFRHRCR
jgi:hypothetical protein